MKVQLYLKNINQEMIDTGRVPKAGSEWVVSWPKECCIATRASTSATVRSTDSGLGKRSRDDLTCEAVSSDPVCTDLPQLLCLSARAFHYRPYPNRRHRCYLSVSSLHARTLTKSESDSDLQLDAIPTRRSTSQEPRCAFQAGSRSFRNVDFNFKRSQPEFPIMSLNLAGTIRRRSPAVKLEFT